MSSKQDNFLGIIVEEVSGRVLHVFRDVPHVKVGTLLSIYDWYTELVPDDDPHKHYPSPSLT